MKQVQNKTWNRLKKILKLFLIVPGLFERFRIFLYSFKDFSYSSQVFYVFQNIS